VQRHVLRLPPQPHHAGPRREHGRRLGDQALAPRRSRLGRRAARHRGDHRPCISRGMRPTSRRST
jgi:hypothetical protein